MNDAIAKLMGIKTDKRPPVPVKCKVCGDNGLVVYERNGCEYAAHCACQAGMTKKSQYPWSKSVHELPGFDLSELPPAEQMGTTTKWPEGA